MISANLRLRSMTRGTEFHVFAHHCVRGLPGRAESCGRSHSSTGAARQGSRYRRYRPRDTRLEDDAPDLAPVPRFPRTTRYGIADFKAVHLSGMHPAA